MAILSKFLVAQDSYPVQRFSHRLERLGYQSEKLVGKDKGFMGGSFASSSPQSINGILQSNDYFPVAADPCVRPELRAHTRVPPYNAAFFDCGSV